MNLGECQSSPSAHIAFYPRTAWPENDDADFEDYDSDDDKVDGTFVFVVEPSPVLKIISTALLVIMIMKITIFNTIMIITDHS